MASPLVCDNSISVSMINYNFLCVINSHSLCLQTCVYDQCKFLSIKRPRLLVGKGEVGGSIVPGVWYDRCTKDRFTT